MRFLNFLLMAIILASVLQICPADTIKKNLRSMKMTRPVLQKMDITSYVTPLKQQVNAEQASTESPAPGGFMGKMKHIIAGSLSTRGQFPFLVGIDIDGTTFCGGSLISTTHILTAGHCTEGSRQFDVYLGGRNLDAAENGRVKMSTQKKVLHPMFNLKALINDLSIITLKQQVKTSQFIQIVRLPSRAGNIKALVGTSATVAGWGRTSDAAKEVSNIMYHAKLTVQPQRKCVDVYGSDSFFHTNICAYSPNQATCQGDSGGPLVVRESDNEFTQIGVVSFGASAGCQSSNPDVFTRVASYLPWITSTAGIGDSNAAAQQASKTKTKKRRHKQKISNKISQTGSEVEKKTEETQ